MVNRDFKGVWIPKEIFLNKELNWTDKILLIEIDSLDNKEGCFASNDYFAKFLEVSVVTISNSISKLKRLGFIEQTAFDGKKRTLRNCEAYSKLKGRPKENFKADLKKTLRQTQSKLKGPIYNNTPNNTFNNTFNKEPFILTPQAQFMNYWKKLYKSVMYSDYRDEKKDYIIASNLLKKYPLEVLNRKAEILLEYCKNKSRWFTKNGIEDFTVNILSHRWNNLIGDEQLKLPGMEVDFIKLCTAITSQNEKILFHEIEKIFYGFNTLEQEKFVIEMITKYRNKEATKEYILEKAKEMMKK